MSATPSFDILSLPSLFCFSPHRFSTYPHILRNTSHKCIKVYTSVFLPLMCLNRPSRSVVKAWTVGLKRWLAIRWLLIGFSDIAPLAEYLKILGKSFSSLAPGDDVINMQLGAIFRAHSAHLAGCAVAQQYEYPEPVADAARCSLL
jgi:hypothetical protein